MSELQIPEAAYDAADEFLAGKTEDEDSLGAIDAAAPHIVAAELRRLADNELRWSEHQAAILRARATELDGGAA